MSLIYDYLKIYGKSNSVSDSNVEIPPTLKRRDPNRLNSRSVLLVIGSCLIGLLFIFLIVKIFTSGQDMQAAADSVSLPAAPVRKAEPVPAPPPAEKAEAVVQQHDKPAQAAAAEAVFPVTPNFAESRKNIQVFPETGKEERADGPAGLQTASIPAVQPGEIENKVSRPLELRSSSRKITFPKESPIYAESPVPADNSAPVAPFHGDAAVHQASQGSVTADKTRYSSTRPDASQDTTEKFYQAGLQSQHKGDQRLAEIYYKEALVQQPLHIPTMINLSALYVQQQRYAEAEEILAEILKNEPANSKALVNMGMVSLYQNKETLAEAQFKAALAANPSEENALVNLAYLADKKGDYGSTERYYMHLLQISPDNLEVLLAYGHLLEETQRYPEAMTLYGDCLELGAVIKDQQLYGRITQRMRLLAGVSKN